MVFDFKMDQICKYYSTAVLSWAIILKNKKGWANCASIYSCVMTELIFLCKENYFVFTSVQQIIRCEPLEWISLGNFDILSLKIWYSLTVRNEWFKSQTWSIIFLGLLHFQDINLALRELPAISIFINERNFNLEIHAKHYR